MALRRCRGNLAVHHREHGAAPLVHHSEHGAAPVVCHREHEALQRVPRSWRLRAMLSCSTGRMIRGMGAPLACSWGFPRGYTAGGPQGKALWGTQEGGKWVVGKRGVGGGEGMGGSVKKEEGERGRVQEGERRVGGMKRMGEGEGRIQEGDKGVGEGRRMGKSVKMEKGEWRVWRIQEGDGGREGKEEKC